MSPILPSILAVLATTQVAEARETGAIHGTVQDEDGLEVPNATVTLSGPELAGELVAKTRADGTFRFERINPGTYTITVTLNDARIARAQVQVSLLTTTYAAIDAKLGGVSEEVQVVYKPVVDTTSTAFSTSLGEEAIQNLPVGRTYQDVIATIPGVSGRIDTQNGGDGNGNPSVRGEGQYGNNYTIDGVMIRDPATKTFAQNINFDAIESIQVFTDGAPAEFGQFTGMMANIVTKDGGDEHHGTAAIFYSNHAYFDSEYDILQIGSEEETPTTKRRFSIPVINLTAGGPIIKEKLWYFVGLQGNPRNYLIPEGLDAENAILSRGGEFLGKLTWFPSKAVTLRYLFIGDYTARPTWDAGQFVLPEAVSDRIDWGMSHILKAELAPSDSDTFELRGGFINNNIDIVPASGDELTPARLDEQGVLHDNAFDFDYNDRNRFGGGLAYEGILDGFLGDHKFRAGGEYWTLLERREIISTGRTEIEWIDSNGDPVPGDMRDVGTRYLGGSGFPCGDAENYSDCGGREHWTNVGPLDQTVYSSYLFLQDEWQPNKNLTMNLGVRMDIEDGRNNAGDRPTTQLVSEANLPPEKRSPTGTLGPLYMPAPRLGVSFDPFGDSKTKISAHYGQYYDLVGNNFWQWSNTRASAGFVRFRRPAPGEDFAWSNTQDPEGNPLIYASDAKPYRVDKVNVGIEREVVKDVAIGVRGILSQTTNMSEDIDVNLDDWYIMNSPLKKRTYRGLEVTLNKRFDERWQLFGAYTLSEAYGHTPGQFELPQGANSGSDGNNVGVYLDDIGDRATREAFYEGGLGWLLDGLKGLGRYSPTEPDFADDAGYYGYLPYHAFHAIKLNGTYVAPFGTKFGLVYEFSSGNAWQKKGEVGFYGPGYSFPEGRGGRFMPAVHWIDVRVGHEFGLGNEDTSLEATLDVFNLPGFAAPIERYQNDAPGFGLTLARQQPRSIRVGLKLRY